MKKHFSHRLLIAFSLVLANSPLAFSETVDNTTIHFVGVAGGKDTVALEGTTCLTVSSPISAACTGGMIAIVNNNSQLLSAALTAKASGAKVLLYYDSNSIANKFHCPGLAFTPCSVIGIGIK